MNYAKTKRTLLKKRTPNTGINSAEKKVNNESTKKTLIRRKVRIFILAEFKIHP